MLFAYRKCRVIRGFTAKQIYRGGLISKPFKRVTCEMRIRTVHGQNTSFKYDKYNGSLCITLHPHLKTRFYYQRWITAPFFIRNKAHLCTFNSLLKRLIHMATQNPQNPLHLIQILFSVVNLLTNRKFY